MSDIQTRLEQAASDGESIVFQSTELTNEEYHANTSHISGSSITAMLHKSLAGWRFADPEPEDKKSKAMQFGTNAHTNMLEKSVFDSSYVRAPSVNDYEDKKLIITSVAGLQSWMKDRGLAGRSKSDPFELIAMIRDAVAIDENEKMPIFWHEVEKAAKEEAGERELIKAEDFDKITRMRHVLLENPQFNEVIEGGASEISIFTMLMGVPVKIRIDRVTDIAGLWDYKTCENAEPERFARRSFDLGYHIKMALQYHVFSKAYDRPPSEVVLLAQETAAPFQAVKFALTEKTRIIGTAQLKQALSMYKAAKEADIWPTYNNGESVDLDPPYYVERQYEHLIKEVMKK